MNTEAKQVPTPADAAQPSPAPWKLIGATEHHGPYIVNAWGGDVCDCYVMSNPSALSIRNGGDSRPISFVDADANAALIVRAVNSHAALVAALQQIESLCVIGQEFSGSAQNALHIARAALATAREG